MDREVQQLKAQFGVKSQIYVYTCALLGGLRRGKREIAAAKGAVQRKNYIYLFMNVLLKYYCEEALSTAAQGAVWHYTHVKILRLEQLIKIFS